MGHLCMYRLWKFFWGKILSGGNPLNWWLLELVLLERVMAPYAIRLHAIRLSGHAYSLECYL